MVIKLHSANSKSLSALENFWKLLLPDKWILINEKKPDVGQRLSVISSVHKVHDSLIAHSQIVALLMVNKSE